MTEHRLLQINKQAPGFGGMFIDSDGRLAVYVLDTAYGCAAAGVPIRLERLEGGAWLPVGDGVTDADGRLKTLTEAGPMREGTYKIRFETAAYFAAVTEPEYFFPAVEIQFLVKDEGTRIVPIGVNDNIAGDQLATFREHITQISGPTEDSCAMSVSVREPTSSPPARWRLRARRRY